MEMSPLICRADQWAGLCMIETSVLKELIISSKMYTVMINYLQGQTDEPPFSINSYFQNLLVTGLRRLTRNQYSQYSVWFALAKIQLEH